MSLGLWWRSAATALPAPIESVQSIGLCAWVASVSWFVLFLPIQDLDPCSSQSPHQGPNTQLALTSRPFVLGFWLYVLTPWLLCPSGHGHFLEISTTTTHPPDQTPHERWNHQASLTLNLGHFQQKSTLEQFPLTLLHSGPSGPSFPASPAHADLVHCLLTGSLFSVKCFQPFVFLFDLKLTTFYWVLGYLNCSQGLSDNILINCLAVLFQSNNNSHVHLCFPVDGWLSSTWHALILTL